MPASASPAGAAALAVWLEERRRSILDCEQQALFALHERRDEATYRALLAARAKHIAALDQDSAPLVAALPEALRETVSDTLADFSAGAHTALRLGSVFYMSALLYPDDHTPGEPDNLQKLIATLAPAD
jgi:hypothetical protein